MPLKSKFSSSFKLCHCCYKWQCQCLIPRRRKPHPPFNSGTKFDSKMGLHPKFQLFTPVSPGVGTYDPRLIDCKPKATSLEKQKITEKFSARISVKLKKTQLQREFMKPGVGPGTHEILRWPENISEFSCKKSLRENIYFGTVPRFFPSHKSTTPGPGYTLRVHNPYYYLEQKRMKGSSQVPTFEFDNLTLRFRETKKTWSLPCNRYRVKHPYSLQTFLDKVTGKRGPYDLFTGPRDDTTIRGYWTHAKMEDHGDWPRMLPGEMDKFLSKTSYFKGKWTTYGRFPKKPVVRMMLQDISTCYKDPDEPGPGYYDPQTPRKPRPFKRYPFDSNVKFARPYPPCEIHPGPNRYNVKRDRPIKGHGWTCVFKSKVPRVGVIIAPSYSDF